MKYMSSFFYFIILYFYDMMFFLWNLAESSRKLIGCFIKLLKKKSSAKKIRLLCASNWMDRFKNHLNWAVWAEIWKKRNWPGRARAKILYFVSGRAGPGSGWNVNFSFWSGWARTEISIFLSCRAGLGQKFQFLFRAGAGPVLKNPVGADL